MTDAQVKQSLVDRGVRLRPERPDGTLIGWSTGNEGYDWLLCPEADYDKKMADVVSNHPYLTDQEKAELMTYFVNIIAEIPDPNNEGQYLPYLDITIHEFGILYVGRSANVWVDRNDESVRIIPCATPIMFNTEGEIDLMRLWGEGYDFPFWKYEPKMQKWKRELRQL